MKENKAVGPNLKTYYYYTNAKADETKVKGVIILATGMEGSGNLYDEIGGYLDSKGYALYAIDELGYGKTGEVRKKTDYKNWKHNSGHYASYNVHSLSVLAKNNHKDAPVYLVGNDFGSMLSLYLIREFPEVVDKVVTIGWGAPRLQDYCFLFNSFVKKIFLYDDGESKLGHWSKNKRYAFRFERGDKYAWLTSDQGQLEKIKNAGYLDTAGTVGHYYNYFKFKVKVPSWMKLKKCDKATPMLLISGDNDLSTLNGRTTRSLERMLKMRGFSNVSSLVVPGRHELLFEDNRFAVVDKILSWLGNSNELVVRDEEIKQEPVVEKVEVVTGVNNSIKEEAVAEEVIEVKEEAISVSFDELQEAEDELLISARKEEK